MRRPALTLLLLCFLTFFLGLGRQAITDSDEAFYAEASREMVELGDWLTPHFNYEDRWQKPALYYWLTAATYVVTGPSEFAARFWSALSGLSLVFVTWAAARRMRDGERSAWLAGAIVATCFGCFALARAALPDLPLAFLTTACISAALRASDPTWRVQTARPARADIDPLPSSEPAGSTGPSVPAEFWWGLAGLSGGLGFLMKGPVAVVIPAVVLLPIWWRERRTVSIRWRGVVTAIAIAAIVGLPWYVAMTVHHGSAYLQSFFIGDNLERFTTGRFNDRRPIWFYVPIVLGGMLPWSAYLVALPGASLFDVLRGRRRLSNEEWRLILWAGLPLALFAVSIGQQPRYILPLLPPLAMLLARSLSRRINEARSANRQSTALLTASCVTAALLVLLTVLLVRAQPLFIAALAWVAGLGAIALMVAAISLAWVALTRKWEWLLRVMIVSSATMLLTIQFGAFAGARPEPVEQVAALVRAHRTGTEPVGHYRVFVRNLVFYTRVKQVEIVDEAQALTFLQSPERVLLVLNEDDLLRLQSTSGTPWQTLGRYEYLNAANIRVRDVLWPNPAETIETVVLIANR